MVVDKEVMKESRRQLSERKVKEAKQGNQKIKQQYEVLQQELDTVKMPIIDLFKDSLLKQKVNAFKRTMKGCVEREVNEYNLLPSIVKKVGKQKEFRE